MNSITSDTLNPLRSITSGTSVTIAETGGHDAPKRSVTINRNDRSRSPKYAADKNPTRGGTATFSSYRLAMSSMERVQ